MAKRAKRGDSKESTEAAITKVLAKNSLSVTELAEQIPATYWATKKAIDRMEKKGLVVKIDERRDDSSGRAESVYMYVGEVPLTAFLAESETAEEEEAHGKVDIGRGVIFSIVTKSVDDPEFDYDKRREYFALLARKLKNEDPRMLLLAFAEWLTGEFKAACTRYEASIGSISRDEASEIRHEIESLQRLSQVIFNRNLGVPSRRETLDGKSVDGPFRLRYYFKDRRSDIVFEKGEVAAWLGRAVLGGFVIEKRKAMGRKPDFSEAGTDASVQRFDLSLMRSAFGPVKMAILTAAAARLNFADSGKPEIDAEPEPSRWQYYTEDKAIDEGLLVPPEAYLSMDDMIWERVTSAAMNLRQYIKDGDCFKLDKNGRIPDVLFRDGRIFPLEHLFDDYCRDGLHGRIVRKSIENFRVLLDKVSASYPSVPRPLYCGAVKRPEVSILAPLLFWYMRYGTYPSIWQSMDPKKYLYNHVMPDQKVAHYLFAALCDELGEDERWVTCRFVRRFVAMNERISWFAGTETREWIEFLEEQKKTHDFPSDPEVDPYAELCAHAAISSFFVSLPRGVAALSPEDYLTPRYEVLLPAQVSSERLDSVAGYDNQVLQVVLMALCHPGGVERYPDYLDQIEGRTAMSEAHPGTIFIFPTATTDAHIFTKEASALYHKETLGYFWKIIIEVQKNRRRAASVRPRSSEGTS